MHFLSRLDMTVNPARAGMIRQRIRSMRCIFSKPRASGDDPAPYAKNIDVVR